MYINYSLEKHYRFSKLNYNLHLFFYKIVYSDKTTQIYYYFFCLNFATNAKLNNMFELIFRDGFIAKYHTILGYYVSLDRCQNSTSSVFLSCLFEICFIETSTLERSKKVNRKKWSIERKIYTVVCSYLTTSRLNLSLNLSHSGP